MCLICSQYELGKLTRDEAIRNNYEINYNSDHYEEVIELIMEIDFNKEFKDVQNQ